MPGIRSKGTVPDAYQGREQAYIKHELLRGYLKKLFLIVGMSAERLGITELCYVDCFAGPWGDESEELGSTSIAISLRILDECRHELLRQGKNLRFRALYVEKDEKAFKRLACHLRERAPSGIEAHAMEGDFIELRQQILDWCAEGPFVFFFIDPTKWTPVGVEVIGALLQRPRSEFLINFMYDFLSRAASMTDLAARMIKLLGEAPKVQDLHGQAREKRLLDAYRRNLKRMMPKKWPARSAYVRVLDRKKERPKYHLVYLTSHPRGVIEFMKISENLDQVQKRVRASTKQSARAEKSGMDDLFGADSFIDLQQRHVSLSEVEQYWLSYLARGTRRVGEEEFAGLLEETDWFPGDLQCALWRLIDAGKVRNLDAPRKRPKNPLHWQDNERLQLVEIAK